MADVDVVVIGAGQAGLSSAYFLRKYATDFVVLDANPTAGGAWRHRRPGLSMDKVHGFHALPGLPLPAFDPAASASAAIADYFAAYEAEFDLPVLRPARVLSVTESPAEVRTDSTLLVTTDIGTWTARGLINATGTWDKPFWPRYPGQELFAGRQLHSVDYRDPKDFRGLRVLVVGGGTSAVEALLEIAPLAAATTWATRRPPVFRDGPFTHAEGRAAVAAVADRVAAGLPPTSVVRATGLVLTPRLEQALATGRLIPRPMFTRLTSTGVRWPDGTRTPADVIIWATGYRAALDHLSPLHLRTPGGGIPMTGTRATADPRVHLVGYGPSASTIGANRAGRAAVTTLRRHLYRPVAIPA